MYHIWYSAAANRVPVFVAVLHRPLQGKAEVAMVAFQPVQPRTLLRTMQVRLCPLGDVEPVQRVAPAQEMCREHAARPIDEQAHGAIGGDLVGAAGGARIGTGERWNAPGSFARYAESLAAGCQNADGG